MRDGDLVTTVDRVNRMNAPSSSGLADFKARYRKANSYFLVPVLVNQEGTNVIKPITDLYIHKSKIHFRSVNDISDNDQDIVVFPEKSR